MSDSQDKKIIIDDDWKAQAEAEREKLSQELDQKESQQDGPMEASFLAHIESLVFQIMLSLGLVEHPAFPGQRVYDAPQARFLIDTIDVLAKKTQGNLDADEQEYITKVLPELKRTFVEVNEAVRAQQARGATGGPMGSAIQTGD